MPMQVLDNKVINLEFFPQQGEGAPGEGTADAAQQKAGGAATTVKDKAQGTANATQDKAAGAQKQASGTAQSWSETAQQKGQGLQKQAGEYQAQTSESLKGYGDSAHEQGQAYVQSGTDYANESAKKNLPESMQGYAGTAVSYAGNAATGTVGTVAGGVKDLGDTVGNAGYDTVAGLGKTGYNLGSGLGSALMGKSGKEEKPVESTAEAAEETTEETTQETTKETT